MRLSRFFAVLPPHVADVARSQNSGRNTALLQSQECATTPQEQPNAVGPSHHQSQLASSPSLTFLSPVSWIMDLFSNHVQGTISKEPLARNTDEFLKFSGSWCYLIWASLLQWHLTTFPISSSGWTLITYLPYVWENHPKLTLSARS